MLAARGGDVGCLRRQESIKEEEGPLGRIFNSRSELSTSTPYFWSIVDVLEREDVLRDRIRLGDNSYNNSNMSSVGHYGWCIVLLLLYGCLQRRWYFCFEDTAGTEVI